MIKKIIIGFLIFLSFTVSINIFNSDTVTAEANNGSIAVLLFSIPFTMCLVNSNLMILPKILSSHNGSYTRYKKGIENIFLSVTAILFILHIGLTLLVVGVKVNLLYLIPVCIGIVLITAANTLPRFQLELNNKKNANEIWNIIIRPFSLPLFIGGGVMLLCVFLPSNLLLIGFFFTLFSTLFVSIFYSYKAYQSIK